jgi:hypothetical protein
LEEAARLSGLQNPHFVSEPVAAALHYSEVHVEVGQFVAVYDLGGGTFDTAVLRRTRDGFEVAGPPGGIADMGGEVFDDRLYRHFGAQLASRDPDTWRLLSNPTDRRWAEENADFRSRIRDTKERLSDDNSAELYVSSFDTDVRLTRAEFEELIRADLQLSVEELARTVADAGIEPEELAAVYLTGGSSRIPLVTTLVHERFKRLPATRGDPKCVVALGATQAVIQPQPVEDAEQHPAEAELEPDPAATVATSGATPNSPRVVPERPEAKDTGQVTPPADTAAGQPSTEPARASTHPALLGARHTGQASTTPQGRPPTNPTKQPSRNLIAGGAVLALLVVIAIVALVRTQGNAPDGAFAGTTTPDITSSQPTSPTSDGDTDRSTLPGSALSTNAPTTRPVSTATASSVVRRYFEAINNQDYPTAYGILGSSFHQRQSYSQFAAGFSETVQDDLEVVSAARTGLGRYAIVIRLVAEQSDGSVRRFSGTYVVGREDDTLKIVSARLRMVG